MFVSYTTVWCVVQKVQTLCHTPHIGANPSCTCPEGYRLDKGQ